MNKENQSDLMTVGELARRAGITVRAIQYYDQKGLLSPTSKGEKNLRLYSFEDEERLYRILTLKNLGYSLSQIKAGEGSDAFLELHTALGRRSQELAQESINLEKSIDLVQSLKSELKDGSSINWCELYQAIHQKTI